LRPLLYLIQKEFRQVLRDRAMLRIVFALPLIQMFLFAYAIQNDLKNIRLATLDLDQTPESRHLLDSFFSSGYFRDAGDATKPSDLVLFLDNGDADMTLWIPKGYSEMLARGEKTSISIQVDGQNSSIAGRAIGYAEGLIRQEAFQRMYQMQLARPELMQLVHRVTPASRFFYNPELETRFYMIPGIVVLIVTVISAMLTGMAVVKEKEIGTLEHLLVTPLTPAQLIAGKTIPFVVLAFFDLSFATAIAILYFKLPLTGSLWLLGFASILYLLVTLGIGLLASTVSQTQQQAMFTVWFFLVFGILMSGFFYPVENMPRSVYLITFLNPLRHYMEIVRGIFLKGVTMSDAAAQLLWLGGLGATVFTAATLRFRKRIK